MSASTTQAVQHLLCRVYAVQGPGEVRPQVFQRIMQPLPPPQMQTESSKTFFHGPEDHPPPICSPMHDCIQLLRALWIALFAGHPAPPRAVPFHCNPRALQRLAVQKLATGLNSPNPQQPTSEGGYVSSLCQVLRRACCFMIRPIWPQTRKQRQKL